jgi:hypothetical protein
MISGRSSVTGESVFAKAMTVSWFPESVAVPLPAASDEIPPRLAAMTSTRMNATPVLILFCIVSFSFTGYYSGGVHGTACLHLIRRDLRRGTAVGLSLSIGPYSLVNHIKKELHSGYI